MGRGTLCSFGRVCMQRAARGVCMCDYSECVALRDPYCSWLNDRCVHSSLG